ncbi:MAG: hypothetical protein IIB95_03815 [Candidatus Marinimicrobia bacterium]|nr:hypothetical protein [Candidatus Neomarinimicrobiota bacterium]
MMIKLTPHEQKILDMVKEHPEVIHDPEKRKEIAEQHGLSEKTLRNRIGDLRKYGVLKPKSEEGKSLKLQPLISASESEINLIDNVKIVWKRHKSIFLNIIAVTFFAVIISLIMPKTFRASAVLMPPSSELSSSILGAISNLPFNNLISQSTDETMSFIAILKSRTVMENVIDKFDLVNFYEVENDEEAFETLSDNVQFEVEEEGTIRISALVSTSWLHLEKEEEITKNLSADLANYFVEQLVEINSKFKSEKTRQNRGFIENRYYQNIEDLSMAEERLKAFQEDHNTVALMEQTTAIIQVATALVSHMSISKVKISISKVKLSILEETLPKDHPEIKLLETEIILLETEITGLNKQLKELDYGEKEITMIPGFSEVPDLGLELGRLMRDVEVQNTLYTFLTQQYEEAKIQEARNFPTVQVLDEAKIPIKKYRPRRALLVVSTFLLILLINVIFVIVKTNYFKITF